MIERHFPLKMGRGRRVRPATGSRPHYTQDPNRTDCSAQTGGPQNARSDECSDVPLNSHVFEEAAGFR